MIYAKENPIGLDAKIAYIQSTLYNELNTLWGIDLEAFERCYILNAENGTKTVNRFKSKNEYEIVSIAEKSKFFFLHRSKSIKEDALYYKSEIEAIFIVDLTKLKPEVNHRADFEVQNDVELLLNQFDDVWIVSCDSGYQNALQGISYDQENDMQPYHVFKFTLGVHYKMDDTGCEH